jgi:hypothetical protein
LIPKERERIVAGTMGRVGDSFSVLVVVALATNRNANHGAEGFSVDDSVHRRTTSHSSIQTRSSSTSSQLIFPTFHRQPQHLTSPVPNCLPGLHTVLRAGVSGEQDGTSSAVAPATEAGPVSPPTSTSSSPSSRDPSTNTKGTLVRTLALALPLLIKFVIVLLIKFATDLVVIPMLLLYRLARRTKRRALAMIGKGSTPDGQTKSGTAEIENAKVNGSDLAP